MMQILLRGEKIYRSRNREKHAQQAGDERAEFSRGSEKWKENKSNFAIFGLRVDH